LRTPDFFIVGHPKCGTTALFEMLRSHPQIFMPARKETNFFAAELRSQPGAAQPSLTQDEFLALFAAATPEQRVGEASVVHLWSRSAAAGIAAMRPDARVIAILREPASFLRSLHLQFVQTRVESEADLGRALALEDARRQGRELPPASAHWPLKLLYSDYVRYEQQLRRYRDLFPAENVLVLLYDDFREDNEATVREVLRFLGVDESVPVAATDANPTVRVRSTRLNDALHEVTMGRAPVAGAVKRAVKAVLPQKARRQALELVRRRFVYAEPEPGDADLMAELRRRFKPEVVAAGDYLGRDLVGRWGYEDVG
jgi:Sulfotransferase domain